MLHARLRNRFSRSGLGAAPLAVGGCRIRRLWPGHACFANGAVASLLAALLVAGTAGAQETAAYRRLLERHVRPGRIGAVKLTLVDYAALRRDPLYGQALADLAAADPEALPGDRARFAFWINAYNLLAIKMVVDHYPTASIRDAGGFLSPVWKKTAGIVVGKPRSLDDIEHGILRPKFHDPRMHVAIVCASVSCPDLRLEPYDGARLEEQLDDSARTFLSNPAKGLLVDEAAKTVSVSSIFKWFGDDFTAVGGVLAFVRAKADAAVAQRVAGRRDAELGWLDYDWSLNDRARAE